MSLSSWKSLLRSLALSSVLLGGFNAGAFAQKSVLDAVKERGVLRAGIRMDNPPHSFIASDGRWQGFDVEIAEAIAEDLGVKLEKIKVDELTRPNRHRRGQYKPYKETG